MHLKIHGLVSYVCVDICVVAFVRCVLYLTIQSPILYPVNYTAYTYFTMAIRPTIKEENPEADFGEIVSWISLYDCVCVMLYCIYSVESLYTFCSHDMHKLFIL